MRCLRNDDRVYLTLISKSLCEFCSLSSFQKCFCPLRFLFCNLWHAVYLLYPLFSVQQFYGGAGYYELVRVQEEALTADLSHTVLSRVQEYY